MSNYRPQYPQMSFNNHLKQQLYYNNMLYKLFFVKRICYLSTAVFVKHIFFDCLLSVSICKKSQKKILLKLFFKRLTKLREDF